MDEASKRGAVAWLSIAAAAAVALAAGLPGLEFAPGHALPSIDSGAVLLEQPESGIGLSLPINRYVAAVALALAALAVIAAVVRSIAAMSPKGLGRFLLKALIATAAVSIALALLLVSFPHVIGKTTAEAAASPPPTIYEGPDEDAEPPAALYWILGAAAAAAVAALSLKIASARGGGEKGGLERIASEAEAARLGILSGGDLGDAITACYRRMGGAALEYRGVERADSMTAREFEGPLIAAGLSEEGVRGLTGLFESVRYGGARPSAEDEAKAIRCLELIEESARRGRRKP
jgi:hypothetical protein